MRRLGWFVGAAVVLALSMGFAALNGGHRVTLRLGFVTLYGLPLTVVVFGSMILGMLIMLVAGVQSDLRVRRILRDRLAREDEEEKARYVDRTQQDLFEGVEEGVEERVTEGVAQRVADGVAEGGEEVAGRLEEVEGPEAAGEAGSVAPAAPEPAMPERPSVEEEIPEPDREGPRAEP